MAAIFFGLWTAVGAEFPGDCGTSTRAKQAALLFERLLLEGGSLVLQLERESISERWLRPLTPGSGPLRAWERLPGEHRPAGPVVSFDTLLESLRVMDVDWAGVVVPPPDDATRTFVPAGPAERGRTSSSGWLDSALNRDLNAARSLGATLAPTPVFAPLVLPEGANARMTRAIVSPDPTRLPWEDLLKLRDHGSVRAARRLMLEIMALSKPDDPDAMLSTLDVLAADIGGLLSDALESVATETSGLIVTRVAAPPVNAVVGAGEPVILMETHSAEPSR
ncbi:MAG: hypothetical protein ABI611_05925 [Solirubrobacteraceae bacterium]